ncbi:MAG: ABC transporter permease [Candidatus Aminicenantes bacterium]|nr:ABC transporter permease [Candidatus Aminicenantes bacterium]
MFDLEQAIREWKSAMRKKQALQDGDLAELESYVRDKIETLAARGLSEEDAFRKVQEDFSRADELDGDYFKARARVPEKRPSWQAPRFMPPLIWNYLKLAGRRIRRQKGYSAIAIGSLALAMAVSLLTVVWAHYELSYDRFHKNAPSLYRLVSSVKGFGWTTPYVPNALYFALKQDFPEVQAVSRLFRFRDNATRFESPNAVDYRCAVAFVDPVFLEMFDFPLIHGDPRAALDEPKSVLLTETAARRFFGGGDPAGQSLLALDSKVPLTVRGVLKEIPETSHLDFDLMMPISDYALWDPEALKPDDWRHSGMVLYVQLKPGTDGAALAEKATLLINERDSQQTVTLTLQRLQDIHLRSANVRPSFSGRQRPEVTRGQINVFLLVALAVLAMGMVNYVNLATARSLKRSKEIGLRKVTGASRADIVRQFLGESVLCSFAALGLAVLLGGCLGLPLLRRLSGLDLDLTLLPVGRLLFEFIGLALVSGLAAGLYPALFVSSFSPQKALKEGSSAARPSLLRLRRALVCVQIVCSATLIMVISVLVLQIRYIDGKDLGFKRDSILVLNTTIDQNRLTAFKAELLSHPAIRGVATGFLPLMGTAGHMIQGPELWWEGKSPDAQVFMDWHFVDEDYLRTYGLELVAGRFFSKDFPADKDNVVLNVSAVKAMGLADPVGKSFRGRGRSGQIIGVIKDFHVGTLKAEIRPMYFCYASGYFGTSVRFDPQNLAAAVGYIADVMKKFEPERPLEYTFLDEFLSRMYRSERLSARILTVFGAVSVLISCLGLFGLISLLAEQRTKEIGVRKVLGASVARIIGMMSADFTALVGAAVVAAAPAGYLISARWLGDFAYRIRLGWWIFAGSGLLVILLALAAMSLRTLRAARANPVESLRYE